MTIDELQVLITANTNQLKKEINKTQKDINGLQKVAEKSTGGITKAFKFLKTSVIALGIGKIIKDSLMEGVNAVEDNNLFEVSMGKWSDSTRKWSEDMQEALGVSALGLRRTTGVIYNMVTSMGLSEENAYKMSKGISLLSQDMASFYNMSSDEAFTKLSAGLTGETEPLKRIGILVNDNTIKQVAYSSGIAKTGAELTEQEKVLARYVAILQQTGNAQGDLARSLDSPANQMRVFKTNIQNLSLAFSNFLLPVLQAVMPYINAFTKLITQALNSLAKLMGFKGSGASTGVKNLNAGVSGLGTGLDKADKNAKKLKGTLASFDEMNVLTDNSSSDSENTEGTGGAGGTGGGFDLGEYDAHLDWIDDSATKVADKIKKAFKDVGKVISSIWNSKPVQSFVFGITEYGKFLFDYWSTMGVALYENILTTWSNIEGNVSNIVTNVSTLWSTMWTDFGLTIQEYSQPIIDGMVGLFNSVWTEAIDPLIQNVTTMWSDFTGILVTLWNKHGKPLLDNIGQFITNIVSLFQKLWDNVLEPIITPFLETLSWLWDKHLKGLIEEVGDFIGKLVNGALEIYNKFIYPIISWISDKLAPVFSFLGSLISGVFGSVFAVISDVFKSILKILGGVIDFIVGVFTGDWKKAWNGIKDVFKGIIDGLVGIFKLPLNLIIDGINAFISGINKIQLPDWDILGKYAGKGFNIKKINKLARGGIVDRPTTAIIGEAGKEVIMPLERNTGWIDELAGRLSKIINTDNSGQPIHLTVKFGEDNVIDKVIEGINKKSYELNEEVILI